jgi:hypothetical protein
MSENGAPTGNVIDARAVFLARQMAALAEESILGCWAKGMFLDQTAGYVDPPCDTEAPRDE